MTPVMEPGNRDGLTAAAIPEQHGGLGLEHWSSASLQKRPAAAWRRYAVFIRVLRHRSAQAGRRTRRRGVAARAWPKALPSLPSRSPKAGCLGRGACRACRSGHLFCIRRRCRSRRGYRHRFRCIAQGRRGVRLVAGGTARRGRHAAPIETLDCCASTGSAVRRSPRAAPGRSRRGCLARHPAARRGCRADAFEQLGGAEALLETCIEYAKTRRAFAA